jgi:formylglycine-generating enzyme required for sulfatase activity
MRAFAATLCVALAGSAAAGDYVQVPAGTLVSAIAGDGVTEPLPIGAFSMRIMPVTKGEFRRFVETESGWQRSRVAHTFADAGYLQDWRGPTLVGDPAAEDQPVVNVSWFAAEAFCEGEGGRLPTWNEWEYVAAADATRPDARGDPAWRARILDWYSTSAHAALPAVGGEANAYGVRDMHGLIWEWVDDFNALLVDGDSRAGNDADRLKFCGAGAINLKERENYAVLMRIALLSSLNASDSTTSLGFRCVRNSNKELK